MGNYSFWGCSSLATVICEMPTALKGDFFRDSLIRQAVLYVQATSLNSYQTTSDWNNFGSILPITSDAIEDTATDKDTSIDAIYNAEGKRSNGINCGINIIHMSDGSTRTVLK